MIPGTNATCSEHTGIVQLSRKVRMGDFGRDAQFSLTYGRMYPAFRFGIYEGSKSLYARSMRKDAMEKR
jgi:hypothetical protein